MNHVGDSAELVERVNAVDRLGNTGQRHGDDVALFDAGGDERFGSLVDVLKKRFVIDLASEIIDRDILKMVAVILHQEFIDAAFGNFGVGGLL